MKYDFDKSIVTYNQRDKVCILKWQGGAEKDDFRTPVMHACVLLADNGGGILIVDRTDVREISDEDKKWMKLVLMPKFKKSGCEQIILVVGDRVNKVNHNEYPLNFLDKKYKVDICETMEEAMKKAGVEETSEKLNMTVEEAKAYMGLPSDANDFAVDEKFWKLSKTLRNDNSDEAKAKLDELSAVYDIATGNRDKKAKEKRDHDARKKFLGKTAPEWKNYIAYSWFKWLVGVVIVILVGVLFKDILTNRNDCSLVSIGHFVYDGEYYDTILGNLGYKNPYLASADVVVPNDLGELESAYADQTSSTFLSANPDIIVTDKLTYKYYYSYFMDISEFYEVLETVLPESVFYSLTPVYCSELEYQRLSDEYLISKNLISESELDESLYSSEEVMVGIMVTDKGFIEKLGYTCKWPGEEPSLVFSIGANTSSYERAAEMLTAILKLS